MADLRVLDSDKLAGKTFRVAEFDRGVCRRSLWCRIDWHDDDWRVVFFDCWRGASHDWRPMSFIPRQTLDIAIEAMRHAIEWIDKQGEDSTT
jgi:hypothetical protein